jgi:hypothetical protein
MCLRPSIVIVFAGHPAVRHPAGVAMPANAAVRRFPRQAMSNRRSRSLPAFRTHRRGERTPPLLVTAP